MSFENAGMTRSVRRYGAIVAVSRGLSGGVLAWTLVLSVGCTTIEDVDAFLMFEGVDCMSDGGPMGVAFTADTHVVELFELTGPVDVLTDCNNCVLNGSGCAPPRRLCRCGPPQETSLGLEPVFLDGMRFTDISKDARYCLRYIALASESPPVNGPMADCECVTPETVRSHAVFCGFTHDVAFGVSEESAPLEADVMLMLAGGCQGSAGINQCLGNQWY